MENNIQPPISATMPPQMPVEPIVSPNKPNLLVILLIIVEVVTLLIAGYFAYQFSQLKKQLVTQPTPTPISNSVLPTTSPTASGLVSPTPDVTANWKTYQLSQLKMNFKMPQQLNPSEELSFTTSQNNLYWNDSPSSLTRLSATSTKSTFEGGFSYLYGCVGYKKSGAGYKFLTYTNAEIDMSSELTKEMVNQNQVKYLVVKSDPNQTIEGMPPLGITEKGYIAAIINTNNSEYPALVIQMKLSSNNTESIFNQVLSTFKFTQ